MTFLLSLVTVAGASGGVMTSDCSFLDLSHHLPAMAIDGSWGGAAGRSH